MQDKERRAGVLLHITSLSGKYPIGTISDAYDILPELRSCGFTMLQVLPVGPTGFGNSPYAPRSSFAGNEAVISPSWLIEDGLLNDDFTIPPFDRAKVDFYENQKFLEPLLEQSARNLLKRDDEGYRRFKEDNAYWLDDYALFMVISRYYNDQRWFSMWPKALGFRDPESLEQYKKTHRDQIELWKVYQYFFEVQWRRLLQRARELGMKIIGDIPIFAAPDSSDTWASPKLFSINDDGSFTDVSGVPPDSFSITGQLWGNPVYDWHLMEKDDYSWWKKRIERMSSLFDVIRIDHFRGFESYWAIKYPSPTAEVGEWKKGPGKAFFASLNKSFPTLEIIAEDLGFITEEVEDLLDYTGYPGMRIASQLLWQESFKPHNYPHNCVAYTGTHDNQTLMDLLDTSRGDLKPLADYLGCSEQEDDIRKTLIRVLCFCNAGYVIFPIQDILGLGKEGRMNTPSTCNQDNWAWRMKEGSLTTEIRTWILNLITLYSRA